jgi:hypothetical protein
MALSSTDAPPRIPASGSPAASAWRCLTISRTRWSMFGSGLQVGSGMTPALRSMKYSCQVASPILSNCEWMICPEDRNTTIRRSNSVGRVENHSVGVRRGMPRVRSVMGAFLFYFFCHDCCYFDQSSSFLFSIQIARSPPHCHKKGPRKRPLWVLPSGGRDQPPDWIFWNSHSCRPSETSGRNDTISSAVSMVAMGSRNFS